MSWKGSSTLNLSEEARRKEKEMRESYKFSTKDEKKGLQKKNFIFLATVVGLTNDYSKEIKNGGWAAKVSGLKEEKELFETVMREKYPELSDKEQVKKLSEYAEGGIEIMYERFEDTGTLDYQSFIPNKYVD